MVAERIQKLNEEMGVNVFMGEYSFGLIEYKHVRSLEMFAADVMPQFDGEHEKGG